jgi:hypothetical protein
MRPLFVRPLLLSVALISGGCASQTMSVSSDCRFEAKSVAEARNEHSDRVVLVEGHYLSRNGLILICDRLSASVPPRCSGLVVPGYKLPDEAHASRSHGVTWTEDKVQVLGEIHGNRLRVVGCV